MPRHQDELVDVFVDNDKKKKKTKTHVEMKPKYDRYVIRQQTDGQDYKRYEDWLKEQE